MIPLEPQTIGEAVDCLRRGELVLVPTETVYGLAADARNPVAIAALVKAKGRPTGHPFPVQIPEGFGLESLCTLTPTAQTLIQAYWPGPLTLVLPCVADLPQPVTAGLGTLGVRCPDHPVMQALLSAFGGPLAVPSANPTGQAPATTVAEARSTLGGRFAVALDAGPCEGTPSTVVSLVGPEPVVLRQGTIRI